MLSLHSSSSPCLGKPDSTGFFTGKEGSLINHQESPISAVTFPTLSPCRSPPSSQSLTRVQLSFHAHSEGEYVDDCLKCICRVQNSEEQCSPWNVLILWMSFSDVGQILPLKKCMQVNWCLSNNSRRGPVECSCQCYYSGDYDRLHYLCVSTCLCLPCLGL